MTGGRLKHGLLIAIAAILAIGVAGAIALHFAAQTLKDRVEQALGPESEVGAITVGWSAIEVSGIRIKGPRNWPAADTLRAQRIVIVPDWRDLLSAHVRVRRVTVEGAYVSILRAHDGRLRVVPSLLESRKATTADSPSLPVTIGALELKDGVLEFYDATVRRPAHRVRLEQLQTTVEDLRLPDLAGRTQLRMNGVVRGTRHNGTLAIDGWVELSSKDSEIAARLRGVDLVAFEPYLVKASEAGVRRGTLDLDLKSTVRKRTLRAPGALTVTDLELASAGGALGTFMGVPRDAVLATLKNRDGRIALRFTLEGNLDDPKFSLNESFARRMASSLADTLGVSVEGLARGVGGAVRGVGDTVMKLFGP